MLVKYVRFYRPGILVSEPYDKKINSREDKVVLPDNAYAYSFFDREETEKDGEILYGKDKNFSETFYSGREMNLAEVKNEMPDKKILIQNMEMNGYERIVMTKFHQAMPLEKNDRVL